MKERITKSERLEVIQEQPCGFLLEQVINPNESSMTMDRTIVLQIQMRLTTTIGSSNSEYMEHYEYL